MIPEDLDQIDRHIRTLRSGIPDRVGYRIISALDHLRRAYPLLNFDREMASFRAITGEEEAATALMLAIAHRNYPHSNLFNIRNHRHKAIFIALVMAMKGRVGSVALRNLTLVFNFDKSRVDLRIPLSNFGVSGGEDYFLQPTEPLDTVHTEPDAEGNEWLHNLLGSFSQALQTSDILKLVTKFANSRNTILYASDTTLPRSQANLESIQQRHWITVTLLILTIMVLQTRKHQALVCDATTTCLQILRLEPDR